MVADPQGCPVRDRGAHPPGRVLGGRIVVAIGMASVLFAGCATPAPQGNPPGQGGQVRTTEPFDGDEVTLLDSGRWGIWQLLWAGGGRATVGGGLLRMAPAAPDAGNPTRSILMTGPESPGTVWLSARLRTVEQLRDPSPNPWESAWLVWAVRQGPSGVEMEYLAVKPNGLELGIVDLTPREPGAPCAWPDLSGCLHPGGQRFIATTGDGVPVGEWAEVEVRREAGSCTVLVGGVTAIEVAMPAMPAGRVGVYSEDAAIEVDEIELVTGTASG